VDHKPPPPNWGTDKLAEFIDNARGNVFASFVHLPAAYKKLLDVDGAFRLIGENVINPTNLSDAVFVLKAHSSYLGSAHLALAGEVPEAFMLMRGCLESSMYALYLNKKPEAMKVWVARNDSEEAKKLCRSEFQWSKVLACLQAIDAATGERVARAYNKTIDFGAHPNIASVVAMSSVSKGKDGMRIEQAYLTEDPETIRGAMKSAAQVGVCALLVLRHVFSERFDLLGLTAKLPDLQVGL